MLLARTAGNAGRPFITALLIEFRSVMKGIGILGG